jgi:hypothetical protein
MFVVFHRESPEDFTTHRGKRSVLDEIQPTGSMADEYFVIEIRAGKTIGVSFSDA